MRLLVAYASNRGSTQEVAETIADTMKSAGREVELRRAAEIEDLRPYEGVVLGGSLYFGRWHEDAARFMSKHRRELSKMPVAVFALGPKTAAPDELGESRAQLDKALLKVPEVEPRSVAVFGGVIDPTKLRFPLNRMPVSDARDWNKIEAWAKTVAVALEPRELVAGPNG